MLQGDVIFPLRSLASRRLLVTDANLWVFGSISKERKISDTGSRTFRV